MKSISLNRVQTLGILSHRLLLNSMRLESDIYLPDQVTRLDSGGWPADAEGRTLLALLRQMEATRREPSYLREILEIMFAQLEENGYLGAVLPKGTFNEQQLSGHNWLLRALLEDVRLTGSQQARAAAERLVRTLYLPLADGAYHRYPLRPEDRVFEGRPDGNLTGDCINGWYLSTDIGCAYMCLDGLSRAYRDLQMPELRPLLEQMIDEFSAIDFVGISMQTHATLSGIRGILCFYEATEDVRYLTLAKRLFALYQEQGMTDNFANYNWFRRPQWTEPCAIVDSFMAAMDLYRFTEEIGYFETAQKIYFNGLGHAQRSNGGFGCDSCATGGNPFLFATGEGGDAYWCCSMRGGEGLAEVAKSIAMEKDGVLHIGLFNPAEISFPEGKLELQTRYPLEGELRCRLTGRLPKNQMAVFVPGFVTQISLTVNGTETAYQKEDGFIRFSVVPDANVVVRFDIPLLVNQANEALSPGQFTLSHGYLLLGLASTASAEPGAAPICPVQLDPSALHMTDPGVYEGQGHVLQPVFDSYRLNQKDLAARRLQVLFPR